MSINFSPTADDYAAYRHAFTPELFARLERFGVGRPGQCILDIGAGTGLLGGELSRRGCDVVLADVSPDLLRRGPAMKRVAARAEELPFKDAVFDVVTAGQCWHWFDRRLAPREIGRVLRDGGTLAVVYQMHLPLPGNVAEATERLILKHRPNWRHANSVGINGQVLRDMQLAGFVGIESFSFDVSFDYTHEAWRGLIRTSSAIGPSLSPQQVLAFDREHAEMLKSYPPTLSIPHRVFAAVARKGPRGI